LLISYLTALHTIGAYSKYVEFVDIAIETSILQNIKYYKGEDIYQQLLFNKATAYYHMLEFKKSDHILKELIKLNPNKESFIKACKRCKRKIRPEYVHTTRASSIFLFMMSAVIIAIEVIVVEPFYNNYVGIVEAVRVGIFLVGIVMLLSGDLFHWWRVNKLVDKFITQVKKHKARKN